MPPLPSICPVFFALYLSDIPGPVLCQHAVLDSVFIQSRSWSSPFKAEHTKITRGLLRVTGTVPNVLSRLLKWYLEVFHCCPRALPRTVKLCRHTAQADSTPSRSSHLLRSTGLSDKPPVTPTEITPEQQQRPQHHTGGNTEAHLCNPLSSCFCTVPSI